MKYIFILLLLFPLSTFAWDKTDTQREIVWQVMHIIDWGQTVDIAKNPGKYYEINPLLGKHPSVEKVHKYMIASSLIHYVVSTSLKSKYRKYWQYVTIGITGTLIMHNYRIGLRINF